MENDISQFSKTTKISNIKEFLENKHKVKLRYIDVYNVFRSIHPKLGANDTDNLINELKSRSFIYFHDINKENQKLCKVLFISPKMMNNLDKFGDVIIIDSTLKSNVYKIPLVIISGINNNGNNVIFGISYVNDETMITYKWIFSNLKSIIKREPLTIYSDGDLGIQGAVEEIFSSSRHLI